MKLFQSAIFRAVCAIIVGILLLEYGGQTLQWLTIVIGGIFFATGLISFIVYHYTKKRFESAQELFDQDGNKVSSTVPAFPIVGVGSMILGAILIFLPAEFVKGIVVVLAIILILGAINQLVNLGRATKFSSVPILFWLFPLVTFGIGVFVLFRTGEAIDLVMQLIGWCMIFYGLVECVDSIKIYQMRKAYDKANAAQKAAAEARAKMQAQEDITEAEVITGADDDTKTDATNNKE